MTGLPVAIHQVCEELSPDSSPLQPPSPPLSLPLPLPLLNLSYFNACLIERCHLSHAVSLITAFLSARTIKPYSH